MSNERDLLRRYRHADRRNRDTLWSMFIGMRADFDAIERNARDTCAECGHNPHTVYCAQFKEDDRHAAD